MKGNFCLLMFLLFSSSAFADSASIKPLVSQTIVYKTEKASEVYFIWTMTDWALPQKKYQPEESYIHNNMAYSLMKGNKDSFSIDLKIPAGTYLNYMFWASKDIKGDSAEGWDTNWGQNYNYYVSEKTTPKIVNDEKLSFAEKVVKIAKEKKRTFSIFEEGKNIFYISLAFLTIAFVIQYIILYYI